MAKNTDEKLNIQEAITAFVKDDISKAGINLFTVLGYDTSLQAPVDDKTQIVYNKVRKMGQKKAIEKSRMLVPTLTKGKDNGQEE